MDKRRPSNGLSTITTDHFNCCSRMCSILFSNVLKSKTRLFSFRVFRTKNKSPHSTAPLTIDQDSETIPNKVSLFAGKRFSSGIIWEKLKELKNSKRLTNYKKVKHELKSYQESGLVIGLMRRVHVYTVMIW